MKVKYLLSIFYVTLTILILVGCSSSNNTEAQNNKDNETVEAENNKDNKENDENTETEDEQSIDDSDLIEAVETAPVYPEVSFQNINWFFGSPDRQPTGGIWVYTSETIPSGFDNTVDWETEDLLLVQINDPKYVDHDMEYKALQVIDDNVVKIVVSLEADESSTDKEPARRYASVEKGELVGKKFLVETVEGDKIDVGLQVKTSELSDTDEK
nr:hypothetical protein [Lysinibacillus timonensis]